MYSAYNLNKQGYNIQPWHTPFSILNQSILQCLILTVAFWAAYKFLRRQVRWSGIPISKNFSQFIVIHTVKGFSIISEVEVDVFLEFSCFCLAWRILSITLIACEKVKVKLLIHVRLFATPWTVAYQAPPSMGFSRQKYWSGLPFPSPGDLPDPGIEPRSPASQTDALPSEPPGKYLLACEMSAIVW